MKKLLSSGKPSKKQHDFYFDVSETGDYIINEVNENSIFIQSFTDYLINNDYPYQFRTNIKQILFEQSVDINSIRFYIENAFSEWLGLQNQQFNIKLEVVSVEQIDYKLVINLTLIIENEEKQVELTL